MDERKESLLILNAVPSLGWVRFNELLGHFGSPQRILEATREELQKIYGIGERIAEAISNARENFNLKEEIDKINENNVSVVTIFDDEYPSNLKSIFDPPILLYVKGKILKEDSIAIAIVGTRRPSVYGKMVAKKLSMDLAQREVVIVSGLARGIDTSSHEAAIEAEGRTIAVLGSGLDVCYPPENKGLIERISTNGAVISEFPMSTIPSPENFPRRNRIISGLTLGTVVVEAPDKSGALITANYALEQGREVFAVPGNIFGTKSKGSHHLIKQGAKLVEGYEDIIDEIEYIKGFLNLKPKKKDKTLIILTEDEKMIYNLVSFEPLHIDAISHKSNLAINKVTSTLVTLEMKGVIKGTPGKMFMRNP
ncbi:DNA-processing protein DprA [bacterium]|nr:DNA-processing protein DprA [bacterium]